MFMGEFKHNLDTKGRVIMPSKFRDNLGDKFVITKGFDSCLSIYSLKDWESLQAKLATMPMTNADARNIRRMIVGGATELEPDKQGRILIPITLRNYANIEKEVSIIGNIDHIEVWSSDMWEKASNVDADLAANNLYNAGITL